MKFPKVDFSIFVMTIVFLLSMFSMFLLFPVIADEDRANFWMELIKIVFSSLLSAGVAYFVSNVQTKAALKREADKESKASINRVNLLKIEILDNKEVLSMVKEKSFPQESSEILKSQISRKVLNTYFDKLVVGDLVLEKLIKYDKKITLFLDSEVSRMSQSYDSLLKDINELIVELDEI